MSDDLGIRPVPFSPNVDRDRLLAPELAEFDARNCRLVDGRAIHHYLHFVEPVLCGLHGHSGAGEELARRVAARELAREPDPPAAPIRRAVADLERAGLAFFVELVAGAVLVTGAKPSSRRPFVLQVADSEVGAAGLVRHAARELMHQYLAAELALRGLDPAEAGRRETYVARADAFGDSVAAELRRRTTGGEHRPYLPQDRLDGLIAGLERDFAEAPHARELFCCWYPGWNRSLFIFNSPFDGLETLPRSSVREPALA